MDHFSLPRTGTSASPNREYGRPTATDAHRADGQCTDIRSQPPAAEGAPPTRRRSIGSILAVATLSLFLAASSLRMRTGADGPRFTVGPSPDWRTKREETGERGGDGAREDETAEPPSYARSDAVRAVEPIWRCDDSPTSRRARGTKLAFVHVFKAAGSTVSGLFKDYAFRCRAGFSRLIGCTGVRLGLMHAKGTWKGCHLKYAVARGGRYFEDKGAGDNVNNTFLERSLDMVGGHFRIGTFDHLRDENGNPAKIRYVSFVRDAAAKFISGKVFSQSKKPTRITAAQLLANIKKEVTAEVEAGQFHSKYSNYLLTPRQQEGIAKVSTNDRSARHSTQLAIRNLVDYNVLIGAVERMPESLELLHHVLDPVGDATTALFESFGMRNAAGNVTASHRSNRSPVSASVMLAKIREDRDFLGNLTEYVKYEQMITNFALDMHMKQYQAMQGQ